MKYYDSFNIEMKLNEIAQMRDCTWYKHNKKRKEPIN